MQCPACSATRRQVITTVSGVYECSKCLAIYGQCYKGDSYTLVLPYFAEHAVDPQTERYYDLTVLGSDGVTRRHGWFDPASKRITQVG